MSLEYLRQEVQYATSRVAKLQAQLDTAKLNEQRKKDDLQKFIGNRKMTELIQFATDHHLCKEGIQVNQHIWYVNKTGVLLIENTKIVKTRDFMGGENRYFQVNLEICYDQDTDQFYIPSTIGGPHWENRSLGNPGFSFEETKEMITRAVQGEVLVKDPWD